MPFNRYSFMLLAIIGLGLVTPNVVAMDYAQIDGGQYQRSQKTPRTFQIGGRFDARTPTHLDQLRGGLARVLDRDASGLDQPLVLRYQQMACDRPVSEELAIPCVYAGGLEGTINSHVTEPVTMSFTTYLPAIYATGEQGASLSVRQSVANAKYVMKRSPAGLWSTLGGGIGTGAVQVIARGLDGSIYLGGAFTLWGDANGNNIVKYDPLTDTFSSLGTGTNSTVNDIKVLPDGRIVVAGAFTLAGGVANTRRIAIWDPATSTWSALDTGADDTIRALAVTRSGGIYAAGAFTSVDGIAASRIAYWNGSAWSALGTGMNAAVWTLAIDATDRLYVGGQFTTGNGVTLNGIGYWNGSTFVAMAGGVGAGADTVYSIALSPDGFVYVGGTFTSAGGVSANRIARWNGTSFEALGSGFDSDVRHIFISRWNDVYAVGAFQNSGSLALADGAARLVGTTQWVSLDVDFPGGGVVANWLLITDDGTTYAGYNTTGTATTAATTTVTNSGTAASYPILTIKGPSSGTSRIFQMIDTTTNRAIYFNYTINAGETAILRLIPNDLSFRSDYQGDIAGTILPGSNEADFFLQPGANTISFFAASSTVTATLSWTPGYAHLSDATYQ